VRLCQGLPSLGECGSEIATNICTVCAHVAIITIRNEGAVTLHGSSCLQLEISGTVGIGILPYPSSVSVKCLHYYRGFFSSRCCTEILDCYSIQALLRY
jgi:hypothetical protein